MTVKDLCVALDKGKVIVCTNIWYSKELAILQSTTPVTAQDFKKLVSIHQELANKRVFRLRIENDSLHILLHEEGSM
nr:MAG TPA: hypothetical protein [Caudoviricetes sp.]